MFSAKRRKRIAGLAPDLLEVALDGVGALGLQPVDPPGALRLLGHQPGALEHPEVPRDGRPADGQLRGELGHRPVRAGQQAEDLPPVLVAEGVERVARLGNTELP